MAIVVAEIRHGLGNQLFQYAFGSWFARRLGRRLWLDTRWYRQGKRRLGLTDYAIKAPVLTPVQSLVKRLRCDPRLMRGLLTSVPGGPVLVDEVEADDFDAISPVGDVLLRGFWQSWRWADAMRGPLLEELQLRAAPSPTAAEWIRRCRKEPVIGLHARRGDFLESRHQARYPQLTNSWYRRALATLDVETKTWPLLVFSDDPAWVAEHFDPGREFDLVSVPPLMTDLEAFEIFRCASAFVTAASTFSWWAAWLSGCPASAIVAPARWNLENPRLTRDLLPPGWRTVAVD